MAAGQHLSAVELSVLTLMGELCEDMDRGCFSEIDTTVYHCGCQNTGNACCELSIERGPGPGSTQGSF